MFEKIKEKTGAVIKKKKEILEFEKKKKQLNTELVQKEKEIFSQKDKILQKKTGKDMIAVKNLEEEMQSLMNEKQELKTEISALLLNIDRPLQRFKQLVDSGRWKIPKEEKDIMQEFIVNPIIALKKDPKAELFKKVLLEIRKAIEEGAVELKDKEKEKRLEALQELINFDFFGKVFWKMNEIQKKQNDLNKELQSSIAKKEVENEEGKLKDVDNELSQIKEKIAQNENALQKATNELQKNLGEVKEFAQKVLGKTIIFEEEIY